MIIMLAALCAVIVFLLINWCVVHWKESNKSTNTLVDETCKQCEYNNMNDCKCPAESADDFICPTNCKYWSKEQYTCICPYSLISEN